MRSEWRFVQEDADIEEQLKNLNVELSLEQSMNCFNHGFNQS